MKREKMERLGVKAEGGSSGLVASKKPEVKYSKA
jgi:hypothetical protein